MREVVALPDAKALHGGRRARDHPLCLAQEATASPRSRVDEVLGIAGLEGGAMPRAKASPMGMGQRLGIALALRGTRPYPSLDEPVNGLDPDPNVPGPDFMSALAAEGPHRAGLQPPDEPRWP